MISFDSNSNIFKLDTANSSYVIGICDYGHVVNLYYGSKIDGTQGLIERSFRPRCASFSPLSAARFTSSMSAFSTMISFSAG